MPNIPKSRFNHKAKKRALLYTGSYGAGAATNKFWAVLGNHDWATPGATPHLNYFAFPNNERYYRFLPPSALLLRTTWKQREHELAFPGLGRPCGHHRA